MKKIVILVSFAFIMASCGKIRRIMMLQEHSKQLK